MEPIEGVTYTDKRGIKRYVVKVNNQYGYVDYLMDHYTKPKRRSIASFKFSCMGEVNPCAEIFLDKPLDRAFKELDKQLCSHRNIREDRFFSAMVYKTCKDCGKALN